jgi:hypothetical protein
MAQLVTRLLTALVLASCLAVGACDSAKDVGDSDVAAALDDQAATDVPYVVPNPDGKVHGEPCTDASECRFQQCIAAPSLTKGAFRICTKYCGEGPGSGCDLEGREFTCVRFSAYSGDDLDAFCVKTCATVAECPAGYTGCGIVGALKVCTAL